ncbi:hypothetical protein CEXT_519511 [Caerostris extrusa]|uniref:Uncharacterized protein n=1 Tax=Caerostris extrusa TaxID=172846 RepID=A0AAV4SP00_CAEEX|nr:hypothetical protein CEXT_519511 [Caerostris extrusa]
MRSLPPAYIYAFPKYDPLHCAAIKKTAPTVLECHKMTLTMFEKDFIISEKRDRGSCSHSWDSPRNSLDPREQRHPLLHRRQQFFIFHQSHKIFLTLLSRISEVEIMDIDGSRVISTTFFSHNT